MATLSDDQPCRWGAECEPVTFLPRVLGMADCDELAAALSGAHQPIWETSYIVVLPFGSVRPSEVLARLRQPAVPL